ncbi:uncharacterized protein [Nicotiana tomentosiformis]|uniref:uncharacterized protein n=1 Tax=Nicotiana tomentosiformis TaxID=4098 RepID=UPI00388CB0F3
MVADALNRRPERLGNLAYLPAADRPLALDVQALANRFVRLDILEPSRVLACMVSRYSLYDRIKERQYYDSYLLFKNTVPHNDTKEVTIEDDGVLWMQGQLCVPNVDGLRELILQEAHSLRHMYYYLSWLEDDAARYVKAGVNLKDRIIYEVVEAQVKYKRL